MIGERINVFDVGRINVIRKRIYVYTRDSCMHLRKYWRSRVIVFGNHRIAAKLCILAVFYCEMNKNNENLHFNLIVLLQ